MTTYLLHGGNASKQNIQNEYFFKQFTELVNKTEVTILLCYFATPKVKWEKVVENHSTFIKKNSQKSINFLVAENPQDLLEKLVRADVLYIAGGDADLIEPLYKDLIILKEKLDGKVFAGSSMGAFLASEQYVLSFENEESKTIHQGNALLPVQILCHVDVDTQKQSKINLLNQSSKSPIILINECETVTIYR